MQNIPLYINVRVYRRGNQNGQSRETSSIGYTGKEQQKKNSTQCWTLLYEINTNNLNKTSFLLQTTGGKDEPNIETFMAW